MRSLVTVVILGALGPATSLAQSPFGFREASLLEGRIAAEHLQPDEISLGAKLSGRLAAADPFVAQRTDEKIYASNRWLELLSRTDLERRIGDFETAEKHYLSMLEMLRKMQGPASSPVALLLDHIGEFYLDARDFDQAHEKLLGAVQVRRADLGFLDRQAPGDTPEARAEAARTRLMVRLHLADMLTRLGQIDLAKGDLATAEGELSEAVAISNESGYRRFVSGLYAIYFRSLVLEKQAKWQQAEDLWKEVVKLRENMTQNDEYWDGMKEMAAFYARRGDFHSAADIASRVAEGTAGKKLTPELPLLHANDPRLPLLHALDSRSGERDHSRYAIESEVAMSEILAMDKWRTDGPDAAAPLLKNLYSNEYARHLDLDAGPDSERAQLLAWFEKRAFLHMSILLDGDPSAERVATAYEALSYVKGRYLSPTRFQAARNLEADRLNPGYSGQYPHLLDQRTEASASHAHEFIASALDGQPFSGLRFASQERAERYISEEIQASAKTMFSRPGPRGLRTFAVILPSDSALIDIVEWERSDRAGKAPPRREYGVFIGRKDQAIKYVRIGPADSVDSEIDGLETGVLRNRVRGFQVSDPAPTNSPAEVQERLKSLYRKVIAPIEGSLGGVARVFIVPDGKLTLAPIGGFLDPEGHYFLERYTISYLGSWRDLEALREPYFSVQGNPSPPVIVANPDFDFALPGSASPPAKSTHLQLPRLRGAELEAHDVEKALHVPAGRVLIGKMAREELIRSIADPQILHFATHSVPDLQFKVPGRVYDSFEFPAFLTAENPLLQSVIALAGANRSANGLEDGLLTGSEIASLRLAVTQLVVLSSCESGRGIPVDGQGILGLRAAFAMAGAQVVVMSLWPVNDEAGRQFMQFFYAHLADDPANALRLAQLDMRAKTPYKDPFYWAGYAASGIPRPTQPISTQPIRTTVANTNESFVMPNCFEVTDPARTVRIRIGGVVRASQASPEKVVYDMGGPGSDVEEYFNEPSKNSAYLRDWWIRLTVERQPDYSALSVQTGRATQIATTVTLKGAPSLFPTFDIPEALPPLTSYTSATASDGGAPALTLQKIGFCGAEVPYSQKK